MSILVFGCSLFPPTVSAIDFDHDVVPVLRKHCVKCHGGEEAKGGFSLNSRQLFLESDVAVPGKLSDSLFWELITSSDPETQMPPPELSRLTTAEKQVIADWVGANMPWTAGFRFDQSAYRAPLLPRRVEFHLPAGSHPIDALLRRSGGAEVPLADDATFLRRATLDLTGLLPTPEQRNSFLADRSADKHARLVDELLASDRNYTEHWLTFFNDLFRNDYDGTGFITGGRKQISGWLYDSLMDNKPFDQMTRELVAPSSDESRGFIDGIKWRGTVSAGQTNEIQFAQSVAQSFLGINLKCASCHDSFIDQWKLSDAYALAAIYSTKPLPIHRCDKPTGEFADAGWLFPELGQVDKDAGRDERLKQLAALVTDPNNGRYARTIVNRLWAQLMGRGIVHPLDAMHTEPWNQDLLDHLANQFVDDGYNIKALLRLIATSEAYRSRSEVLAADPGTPSRYRYAGRRAKRMTAEQFIDAVWQLTGAAPKKIDAPVDRRIEIAPHVESAVAQAQWIWGEGGNANQNRPAGEQLAFRKTFRLDRGVVSGAAAVTADNEFRLYINGREYSQGQDWTQVQSVPLRDALRPGDNEIIAIARNGGESPNPAGLYVAGVVNLDGGEVISIATDRSWKYSDQVPQVSGERALDRVEGQWRPATVRLDASPYEGTQANAISVLTEANHTVMVRAALLKADFLMRSLGRPNRDQIVTSRPDELTTLEAIDLANGGTLSRALQVGAEHYSQLELSTPELVRELFLAAMSRAPTAAELKIMSEQLGDQPERQSWEDAMWAICMMPEFIMVR